MSKNISVEAHVNRYLVTELHEVVNLIKGLEALVEKRRGEEIIAMEAKLALLKSGEVPVEAPKAIPAPRRTRGGKQIAAQAGDTLV